MKWLKYSFLAVTPFLALGILLGAFMEKAENSWSFPVIAAISSLLFFSLIFILTDRKKYALFRGTAVFSGFFLLGYYSIFIVTMSRKPLISQSFISEFTHYAVTIDPGKFPADRYIRYAATSDAVKANGHWLKSRDRILLYIQKDSSEHSPQIDYGDRLLIKGHPLFYEKNGNPHTFDYAQYLQRHGIYWQGFIKNQQFLITGKNHDFSMKYLAARAGDHLEKILSEYIRNERELNLARAMLTGRRDEISPEMKDVYSVTGTAHILAVSGLHVGIVFLLLSRIFRFLKRRPTQWAYYVIQLAGIWAFAIMTGLSPPVQRAGIMFSFIIIAQWTRRNSNIYNTLFAAAFLILLFSPNMLFSVSFQLSFTAVLGIVYLYPKIYRWLYVNNRILDFFWQITALSIAAQIATFPISVYYFHRFPVLFPVTNLFAIPTATVVIMGGMLLFALSPIGAMAIWIGKLLEGWTGIYHDVITRLGGLPFASLENLYLKPHEVFIIFLTVILLIRFLETRRFAIFKMLTAVLVLFAVIRVTDYYTMSRQLQLTVYNTRHPVTADLFSGRTCFTNASQGDDEKYILQPNRNYHRISEIRPLGAYSPARVFGKNTLIVMGGKTILLWQEPDLRIMQNLTKVDYLVASRNTIKHLLSNKQKFETTHLILDGTISGDRLDTVLASLKNDVKTIYAIREKGAFLITK